MGGGIYFFSQDSSESMFSLTNCIFTENSNMGYIGGGIAAEGDAYSLTLTNCILTKNSGGGIYSDRTFTLINSILRGNISFPGVFEPGFDNSTVEGTECHQMFLGVLICLKKPCQNNTSVTQTMAHFSQI